MLENGSFEDGDPIVGIRSGASGLWEGDIAQRVGSTGGVDPIDGANMLQLIATTTTGPSATDVLGFVEQNVDFSQCADEIDRGGLRVSLRAWVNRVAGDAATDTRFIAAVRSSAEQPVLGGPNTRSTIFLHQPGWQQIRVDHRLEPGDRGMRIILGAQEDVSPDAVQEFDGHFFDAVEVGVRRLRDCAMPPVGFRFGGDETGGAGDFEPGTSIALDLDANVAWRGDWAALVGPEQGIVPRSGSQMVRFLGAAPGPSGSIGEASELYHLVRIPPSAADGTHVAWVQAYFNRVVGDDETDERFDIRLIAFPGDPANFRADLTGTARTLTTQSIIEDTAPDPSTWTCLNSEMTIPPGTGYLALVLSAHEDTLNDEVEPEFDGHYADDVQLWIGQP